MWGAVGATWEVRWQPVPPAEGPPVVRRLSREGFLARDATGLLDSCFMSTGDSLASFLSEWVPLDLAGIPGCCRCTMTGSGMLK
jgi:hypothetical protein